jgi:hypothetical protein
VLCKNSNDNAAQRVGHDGFVAKSRSPAASFFLTRAWCKLFNLKMSSGTRFASRARDAEAATRLIFKDTCRIRRNVFHHGAERERLIAAPPRATTDYSSAGIAGANNRSHFMAHRAQPAIAAKPHCLSSSACPHRSRPPLKP